MAQLLLERGSSMYVGYFGGCVWVANDDVSDNDDDDDADGGGGGGSCGTKLLLAVFKSSVLTRRPLQGNWWPMLPALGLL